MRTLSAVIFLLLTSTVGYGQTLLDSLRPPPRQAYVREQYSAVYMFDATSVVLLDPSNPQWNAAEVFNEGLRQKGHDTLVVRLWTMSDSITRAILLGKPSDWINNELARIPDQHIAVTQQYPGAEGYILDVMPVRIIVAGCDDRGLRYGIDALLKLLHPTASWWGLQACRIIDAPEMPVRWFYHSTNVLVGSNVTAAKALWSRAARLRLNGVSFTDYKFSILTKQPKRYFDSLTSLNRYADELGIEIIPGIMPFGYSNGLLAHDPNLASGLPVQSQRFVIEGDTARLVPHMTTSIPNGGFENRNGNTFPNFTFIDKPGKISFADTDIVHSGKTSIRMQDFQTYDSTYGHGRVCCFRKVTPFTEYHVRAFVRTEDLQPSGIIGLLALASAGYQLAYNEPSIPSTTNGWQQIDFTFNSLEADSIGLYFGVWGAKSGQIWWDDLSFDECPFVNLIRRPGAPLRVSHPLLDVAYIEGVDFDTLRDIHLGNSPWLGEYDTWHTPPTLRILPTGHIHNGDTMLVSYYHMIGIYSGQVMITPSDPSVYEIVETQFNLLDSLLAARRYFMQHDEIRVLNWDRGDLDRNLTPGQLLADNVQRCMSIIRKRNKDADIWVWSDMFDEYHNAVKKNYYLVNGDLTGSADLLPKDLGMVNWNGRNGIVQNSLSFFAGKGFRQISAPYYDNDENNIRIWKEWTRDTPSFYGMMYTTWQNKYTHLEAFSDYAWNHAPYIRHQPPVYMQAGMDLQLGVTVYGDTWDKGWSLARATLWYRFSTVDQFTSIDFAPTPAVPLTISIPVPTGAQWVQWYITAEDNRGWRTKVPFGDTVYYELGSITTETDRQEMPVRFGFISMMPNPVRAGQPAYAEISNPAPVQANFALFNMLGIRIDTPMTTVSTAGVSQLAINTKGLIPGVYIVTMNTGSSTHHRKLVVR